MSSKKGLILLFISAVYIISIITRLIFPVVDKPHMNQQVDAIDYNGTQVNFHYLHFESDQPGPPIIVFPDPFFQENLEPFAQQLSDHWNVFIPDYSSLTIQGKNVFLSAESRADIALVWLKHMGIQEFHLAGHGFGNSIALELKAAEMDADIKSYTLLSGIGVQEYHFLGYHLLNQPIYSLLYPIAFMVDYGLPIGGWNEHTTIDMERVRFMNELDQRTYRDILSTAKEPVLLLHGIQDSHVSPETAREHQRIIPQSELIFFEGGKHSIFNHYEKWAVNYSEFLDAVERGEVIKRADALPDRIFHAERKFQFGDVPPVYGWGLILILILLSSVTLVSEDLGCIGGGLLVAAGVLPLWIAFLVIYLGILIADVGIYWIGRKLGSPVISNIPFRWIIKKRDVEWSAEMFQTNGFKIIFASRFLPGTRFPTYFTAGLLKTNFNLFLVYFLIAITIWAPLLLGISIFAGQQMLGYLQIYQDYALYIFIGLVLGLYILFKFVIPLATKKGRREFVVRLIRIKQRFT